MELIKKIKEDVSDLRKQFSYPNDGTAFGHFVLKNCISKIVEIEDISDIELDNFIKSHVTDGANDYGVDAVICNTNYKQIHLFQFKYSEGNLFDFNEFKKTKTFLDWLLGKREENINLNKKLGQLIKNEISPILQDKGSITFYYIGNYFESRLESTIDNLKNDYTTVSLVSFKMYSYDDLEVLYDNISLPKNKVVLEYKDGEIFEKSEDYFYIGLNRDKKVMVKSVVASIRAKSLKEALKQNDFKLFELNVRYFKGFRGPINKTIKGEYEKGDKSNFWFLNNGINGICSSYKISNGSLKIKDFQIVNGCQTTRALERVLNIDPDLVLILKLSVISERQYIQEISNKIAVASNKQNAISSRDLHSNDGVQNHLFEEFDRRRVFYDKKGNAWNETANKSKYKIQDKRNAYRKISNVDVALSYLSLFLQIPVSSRGRRNLAFLEEDNGGYYEQIFDESRGSKLLAKKLMLAYKLEEFIAEKKQENLVKYNFLSANSSTDVILGLMGLPLLKLDNKFLSDDLDKIREELGKMKIEDFINNDFELIKRKEIEKYYFEVIDIVDYYLDALADIGEEEGRHLNISNWLKLERNYKKLVKKVKPKLG